MRKFDEFHLLYVRCISMKPLIVPFRCKAEGVHSDVALEQSAVGISLWKVPYADLSRCGTYPAMLVDGRGDKML